MSGEKLMSPTTRRFPRLGVLFPMLAILGGFAAVCSDGPIATWECIIAVLGAVGAMILSYVEQHKQVLRLWQDLAERYQKNMVKILLFSLLRRFITFVAVIFAAVAIFAFQQGDLSVGTISFIVASVITSYELRRGRMSILLLRPFGDKGKGSASFAENTLLSACHEYGALVTLGDRNLLAGRHQRLGLLVMIALFGPPLILVVFTEALGYDSSSALLATFGVPWYLFVLLWICVGMVGVKAIFAASFLQQHTGTANAVATRTMRMVESRTWRLFSGPILCVQADDAQWEQLVEAFVDRVDVVVDWTGHAVGIQREADILAAGTLESQRRIDLIDAYTPTQSTFAVPYSNRFCDIMYLRCRLEHIRGLNARNLDPLRPNQGMVATPRLLGGGPIASNRGVWADSANAWLHAWNLLEPNSGITGRAGVVIVGWMVIGIAGLLAEGELLGTTGQMAFTVPTVESYPFTMLTILVPSAAAGLCAQRSLFGGLKRLATGTQLWMALAEMFIGATAAGFVLVSGTTALATLFGSPVDDWAAPTLHNAWQAAALYARESPEILSSIVAGAPILSAQPFHLTGVGWSFSVPAVLFVGTVFLRWIRRQVAR